MYTIRNILYSIKKYRYVRMQWTFCKNIENNINEKPVFIYAYLLLLTFGV
jgi:hypothetical protein